MHKCSKKVWESEELGMARRKQTHPVLEGHKLVAITVDPHIWVLCVLSTVTLTSVETSCHLLRGIKASILSPPRGFTS